LESASCAFLVRAAPAAANAHLTSSSNKHSKKAGSSCGASCKWQGGQFDGKTGRVLVLVGKLMQHAAQQLGEGWLLLLLAAARLKPGKQQQQHLYVLLHTSDTISFTHALVEPMVSTCRCAVLVLFSRNTC
jgi:hypothetical protein